MPTLLAQTPSTLISHIPSSHSRVSMPQDGQATPIVEPIQKPANVPTGADAAVTSRSGNATDLEPIKPSPVVDEGPAGGADIPSHQVGAADASRPGTQDALRGQGNSATIETFSREDYAPVSRSQRGNDVEAQKAEAESQMTGPGGDDDFRPTSAKGSDEPQPGRVQPNLDSDKNLVEAGTNMAGAGGAESGSDDMGVKDRTKKAKL
ncbi:hypothetical protein BMF94_6572 [Rhodotorula taiwanensis]|uniref:Uncharacterized protein n=1 Tax=Rhodotorula taiwanensis TaxID=741276 RepID=A0A2S5B0Z9_9BASI|nr:hypothetical protein BMF94_6572 [Rhodotorula taiwanensis]